MASLLGLWHRLWGASPPAPRRQELQPGVEKEATARALSLGPEQFTAIVESAMDAIVTIDENQLVILFNPAAENVFGFPAAEILGQPLDRLIPGVYRGAHGEHVRRFGKSGVTRRAMGALAPVRGLRADGTDFPIEASISQVRIDGRLFFTAILRDITERQRAEEALRRSQEQLRMLIEHAPISLAMLDRDMRYLAVSRQWRDEFAAGRDLLGQSHYQVNPDLPEAWREFHDRALGGEIMDYREDAWLRADGTLRWLRRSAHPWRDGEGRIGGIVVSREDITERKRVEEKAARAQKLEALGTLAGGIAHDFNNILVAISGNAKLARAEVPADHPAQASLAEIAKASARAADLVRRIVAFSRTEERKREVQSLAPVIDEVLQLLRATLPARIDLRSEPLPGAPSARVDASEIHEILVNLINNSAHAIGTGAGTITVGLSLAEFGRDAALVNHELGPGRYCRLTVKDDGAGMDAATRARIFDPFFTTKGSEGTGLGLSLVHGTMRAHGGGISVYSEPGRGTMFHLYFPAAEADAPAAASGARRAASPAAGERVLYVDDDEALVFLAGRMLGGLGYRVTGFISPRAALAAFEAAPEAFDIVVTDLSMPQISGSDFARAVLAIRPEIPVLMTSGYVRPEDADAARALGIRELIAKPDTVEELGDAIDRALRSDRTR